jgi:hypothetical protein
VPTSSTGDLVALAEEPNGRLKPATAPPAHFRAAGNMIVV